MYGFCSLKCGDCEETIGYYSDDSGAPHYHIYLCEHCATKQSEENEETDI